MVAVSEEMASAVIALAERHDGHIDAAMLVAAASDPDHPCHKAIHGLPEAEVVVRWRIGIASAIIATVRWSIASASPYNHGRVPVFVKDPRKTSPPSAYVTVGVARLEPEMALASLRSYFKAARLALEKAVIIGRQLELDADAEAALNQICVLARQLLTSPVHPAAPQPSPPPQGGSERRRRKPGSAGAAP